MANITLAQKVSLQAVGRIARDASVAVTLTGVTFVVSDPAVAEIVDVGDNSCKVHGLAGGAVTVVASWTRPEDGVVLSGTSESITIAPDQVVTIEVVTGPVEDA